MKRISKFRNFSYNYKYFRFFIDFFRLQPMEDQKLNYNIQVHYEYANIWRTQAHNLNIWNTIRELQETFGRNRLLINSENKIDIPVSMVS